MSVVELRTRPLASAAFVAVAAAAFACAPGSSYEGLSGGTAEDAALEPPRPVYPVSVALLATRRPKLRWAEVPGATGAVVELCRTRDCAAPHHSHHRGTIAAAANGPGAAASARTSGARPGPVVRA